MALTPMNIMPPVLRSGFGSSPPKPPPCGSVGRRGLGEVTGTWGREPLGMAEASEFPLFSRRESRLPDSKATLGVCLFPMNLRPSGFLSRHGVA